MVRTGLAWHESCRLHDTGPSHPEQSWRADIVREALVPLDLTHIHTRAAAQEELMLAHTADHLSQVEQVCIMQERYPDPDIVISQGSWSAAIYAAGAVICGVEAVLKGLCDNAFCAVRPPGHHAGPNRASGFCLLNNVAIATRWLQRHGGIERIAIVDWDVHHGNGTQDAFYNDPTVYYASIHQQPHYPGSGFPHERGANRTNRNITMDWGVRPEVWIDAVERIILPDLEEFQPEFLLISCGFDAHRLDPLGAQMLEAADFATMTRLLRNMAGGRVVSILEGGYHPDGLTASAVAHVKALMGE